MEEDEVYGDAVIFGRDDLVSALHGESEPTQMITKIDPKEFDDV